MNDPLMGGFEDQQLDPREIQETLIGFLGQTYREVAKFDSHLVSANQFLAPKKEEFKNLAEKIMQESVGGGIQRPPSFPPQHHAPIHHAPPNFIPMAQPPQVNQDPNQLEFSFDNSVTANTINSKLDGIEKKLNSLDKMMRSLIELLESHESKNQKQAEFHPELSEPDIKNQ